MIRTSRLDWTKAFPELRKPSGDVGLFKEKDNNSNVSCSSYKRFGTYKVDVLDGKRKGQCLEFCGRIG